MTRLECLCAVSMLCYCNMCYVLCVLPAQMLLLNILEDGECGVGNRNCHTHARCYNTSDSFPCVCNEGWSGDAQVTNTISGLPRWWTEKTGLGLGACPPTGVKGAAAHVGCGAASRRISSLSNYKP